MTTHDPSARRQARAVLEAHGVYLSERDEAEILARMAEAGDPADVALRTCQCGARIDGFDAYFDHLYEALSGTD